MASRELFEQTLPEMLAASPSAARLGAAFLFRISGEGGGTWTLDLRGDGPSCRPGEHAPIDCAIGCSDEVFAEILRDFEAAMRFYFEGKITITGEVVLAAKVVQLFAGLSKTPAAVGLGPLLTPAPIDRFLREHWPRTPFAVHGDPARLAALTDLPQLRSIAAFFAGWPGLVGVFPPRSSDEYDAPAVTAPQALALYAKGLSAVFSHVETVVTSLVPWIERLRVDLGVPVNVNARCIAYATPKGAGASPHFDANVNFVVQIHGEKIWRLAPNAAVVDPSVRHTMRRAEVPTRLRAIVTEEFPSTMPADTQAVHLRPGSVLFVPRGYWHTTQATEDSLALNFTLSQPDWASLVVAAIQQRLDRHGPWRELAAFAGVGDPEQREAAERRLQVLLEGLWHDVGPLDAREVIAAAPKGPAAPLAIDLTRDWVSILGSAASS